MRTSALALAIVLFAVTAADAAEPNNNRGFDPAKVYDFLGIDTVDPFSGNLNIVIPLGQVYTVRPGFTYQFMLTYNSKVWDYEERDVAENRKARNGFPERYSNAGFGWLVSLGKVILPFGGAGWTYVSSDGHQREFSVGPANETGVLYSTDGSYSRMKLTPRTATRDTVQKVELETADGLIHIFRSSGDLEEIHDRFGNWIRMSADGSEFREGHGPVGEESVARTHRITWNEPAPGLYESDRQNALRRIATIELAAFPAAGETREQARAVYAFTYKDVDIENGACSSSAVPPVWEPPKTYRVPLLDKIVLPDGTTYEPRYNQREVVGCESGTLDRLWLPTKGAIDWDYAVRDLPHSDCIIRPDGIADVWTDPQVGVVRRRLLAHDGTTVLGDVTYRPELIDDKTVAGVRCGAKGSFVQGPMPPQTLHVYVTREGSTTESFFSVLRAYSSSWNPPAGQPIERLGDYGLAFTRRETLDGLLLSSRTRDAAGTLLRTQWALYENDGGTDVTHWNSRVKRSRAVYDDDTGDEELDADGKDTGRRRCHDGGVIAPCWVKEDRSDFDGFGHYRTSTKQSNFPPADPDQACQNDTRTQATNYNPLMGPGSLWHSTAEWLLNMYTTSSVSECGVTRTTSTTFDLTTGVVASVRKGAGAGAIVTATCLDSRGFVTSERWLGGGILSVAGDPCSASRREGEYVLTHTNTFTDGALTSHVAQWEGTSHTVADETLDANTGLPISTRDGAQLETTFSFDRSGRLRAVAPPGVAATSYYFSPPSLDGTKLIPAQVEEVTGSAAAGKERKRHQYDSLGRLWRTYAYTGSHVEVAQAQPPQTREQWTLRVNRYDSEGRLLDVSETGSLERAAREPGEGPDVEELDDVPMHVTRYGPYDPFGRPAWVQAADGSTTTFRYGGDRRTARTVRLAGSNGDRDVTTDEVKDAHGRLAAVTEAAGTAREIRTTYLYNVDGALSDLAIHAPQGVQRRAFRFDDRGLMISETHPELGAAGNGTVTYSGFDAKGQATRKRTGTDPLLDLTMHYDPAGRLDLVKRTSPEQTLAQYAFSPASGRLQAAVRWNEVPVLGWIPVSESWSYDAVSGKPVRRDRAVGAGAGFAARSFAHTQTYDELGQIATVGYPIHTNPDEAGRPVVSYAYKDGRLTGVAGWASLMYHPAGSIATISHPGVIEHHDEDPNGMPRTRRIDLTAATGQSLWSTGDYAYDGAGSIRAIGWTQYAYDDYGRLSSWGEATATGFTRTDALYDTFGNRTGSVLKGCSQSAAGRRSCYQSSMLLRQLAGTTNHYSDASYDEAGNVVGDYGRTFTYDSLGMPTSVSVAGRTFLFLYSVDNERIAAVEPLANGTYRTTWTLRGFQNELLTVWNGDVWKEDLIWRGGSLLGYHSAAGRRHYTLDHLGSPRVITDDAGNVVGTQTFEPFGGGGSVGSGSLQFTAHERDAANLGDGALDLPDYAHARLLDTGWGRFLAVDPVMDAKQATAKPQMWNRYAYVGNNPVNAVDLDGKLTIIIHGTRAGDAQWSRRGQPFNKAVSATFGEKALPFDWSGGNSRQARTDAANALAKFIRDNHKLGEPLNLVAHSHGGNIVKEYTHRSDAHLISNFVALGTPQRSDYTVNTANVSRYVNVFSNNDGVQVMGGGFADGDTKRNDPLAKNIDVSTIGDRSIEHSDLHTPSVWQRLRDVFK